MGRIGQIGRWGFGVRFGIPFSIPSSSLSFLSSQSAPSAPSALSGLSGHYSADERLVQRVDVIVEGALTWHLKHGGLSTLPGNQESHARHLRTVGARMIVVRTREHVVRSHVLVDERDTPSNSD